jgi:acetoin utilization protein AcuB
VRHLPVVDEQGELVGILSDRDLRSLRLPPAAAGETSGPPLLRSRRPVADFMSGGVISVDPAAHVGEIIDVMLEESVGALPVVDEDGELVGIVSYVDVLRGLRRSLPEESCRPAALTPGVPALR